MKLLQQGNPVAYYMPIFGSLVQVLDSSQVRPGARGTNASGFINIGFRVEGLGFRV